MSSILNYFLPASNAIHRDPPQTIKEATTQAAALTKSFAKQHPWMFSLLSRASSINNKIVNLCAEHPQAEKKGAWALTALVPSLTVYFTKRSLKYSGPQKLDRLICLLHAM